MRRYTFSRLQKEVIVAVCVLIMGIAGGIYYEGHVENEHPGIIRLHIVANSDSPEDQLLKLKVRNELIHFMEGQQDLESARTYIDMNLKTIEERAECIIEENGFAVTLLETTEPVYVPKDDPRVVALMDAYREITGDDTPAYTMGGGTYSRVVPNAISFGPGMSWVKNDWSGILPPGHGHAHGPDEAVSIRKLTECFRIYVAALAALDDMMD